MLLCLSVLFRASLTVSFPVLWKFLFSLCCLSKRTFSFRLCVHSCISYNSCFRPQLGCLQAGRRSETLKGGGTMSTTTPKPLRGPDPSFRYNSYWCRLGANACRITQHGCYWFEIKWCWVIVYLSVLWFLFDRDPQTRQQPYRVPLHPNQLPLRRLFSAPQAPSPHLNLASCRLGGRFAVLLAEDPFTSTTTQKLLPGWEGSECHMSALYSPLGWQVTLTNGHLRLTPRRPIFFGTTRKGLSVIKFVEVEI